mmetsp:Transcript_73586/g.130488  ORF Transcript_73586/g.130488 Transcript_73586/m.130488 type:complete len:219 (-) Transcript_73586:33-689(-)
MHSSAVGRWSCCSSVQISAEHPSGHLFQSNCCLQRCLECCLQHFSQQGRHPACTSPPGLPAAIQLHRSVAENPGSAAAIHRSVAAQQPSPSACAPRSPTTLRAAAVRRPRREIRAQLAQARPAGPEVRAAPPAEHEAIGGQLWLLPQLQILQRASLPRVPRRALLAWRPPCASRPRSAASPPRRRRAPRAPCRAASALPRRYHLRLALAQSTWPRNTS